MCRKKRYVYWSNRQEHALYPVYILAMFVAFMFTHIWTDRLSSSLFVQASEPKQLVSPVKDYLAFLPTPKPTPQVVVKEVDITHPVSGDLIDIYTGNAIDEFFAGDPGKQSEMRMIMHCLLFHESRHDYVKGYGDGGMAGGPLQFWQETWVGMRQQMIDQGVATEIGDRTDLKEAIRTTVWAIKSGRGADWGPIYRSVRGEGWNTCPVPSFY